MKKYLLTLSALLLVAVTNAQNLSVSAAMETGLHFNETAVYGPDLRITYKPNLTLGYRILPHLSINSGVGFSVFTHSLGYDHLHIGEQAISYFDVPILFRLHTQSTEPAQYFSHPKSSVSGYVEAGVTTSFLLSANYKSSAFINRNNYPRTVSEKNEYLFKSIVIRPQIGIGFEAGRNVKFNLGGILSTALSAANRTDQLQRYYYNNRLMCVFLRTGITIPL